MAVIEVYNLHKRYREVVAVDDVSFAVEPGEIFGILGPNGAGKTTTVECVSGLRHPDRGSVEVLGLDPRRDRDEIRELVGVQLQESQLPERMRVREALDLYASFYRNPADATTLLERLGLSGKRDAMFRELSGGQRQRLSIALALIGTPRVAILDELTTGLDPNARREVWSLIQDIKDRDVTVVLVTHFMEEAERLCDRVAVIDAGRVVAIDSPSGLVSGVGAEQRIHFRTSVPFDERALAALPEVSGVRRDGARLTVTGWGDVLASVVSLLARQGVIAEGLRLEQASLDDAYAALTGRAFEPGACDGARSDKHGSDHTEE
jgi:ABC-2 type transport system ATP-binding protein